MAQDDLDRAFREGRLSRRAYVRQLVDRGIDMPAALAQAEGVVPTDPVPPPPADDGGGAGDGGAVMSEKPRQVDQLEINFVGDGYIVYHRIRRRMHSLNNTAALVLELCTGENDAAEIARLLRESYGLDEPPLAEVRECLASLFKENLIK